MTRTTDYDGVFNNYMLLAAKAIIGLGLSCIAAYALQFWDSSKFVSITSTGLIVAVAALLTGGLLGFLFGIPRTLQDEALQAAAAKAGAPANGNGGTTYRVNTNLEQISDWLTKILVGIGLVQIGRIGETLRTTSEKVAAAFGTPGVGETFAVALMLYFLICGFLLGYLWTRLYLAVAFRDADGATVEALSQQVDTLRDQVQKTTEEVDHQIETLRRQSELDGEAINLIERQLRGGPDVPRPSEVELSRAMAAASPSVHVYVFNVAQQVRSEHWRHDKARMERTIPVFRALIECDREGKFHRTHAQLGYALKDKEQPTEEDLRAAEAALSEAIKRRGDWRLRGSVLYEFNRALCRIQLDPHFRAGRRSADAVRRQVMPDLEAADSNSWLKASIIPSEPLLQRWRELNPAEPAPAG